MGAALKTVLMIEDNPADAEIIREELSMTANIDFEIETVTNLADGLSFMEQHDVTGVLLDLSLPDSHGIDTFKRAREKAPEVPIVVMTGNDDELLGLQAVREGAQDYIVKGHLQGNDLARAVEYAIERKFADGKLRRAKELEAISHMSMGMVKDINNVLAVILMNLQSLEWPLRDNNFLTGQITAARRAVYRGASLTKRLSKLSKMESMLKKVVDINQQISGMAELHSDNFARGCVIRTRLATVVSPVRIDPLDFETALGSLLTNARESMSGGGRITVTTDNVTVVDGEYAENDAGPGSYVVVSVSDIGIGMSEKQRRSAIEPFYSTKSDAEGHGLGLSMVSGFVRRSGGFMRIMSEEGAGTCIEFFLPALTDAADQPVPESVDPLTQLADGETVLVLDGDDSVCEAVAAQIEEMGYTALQANTRAQAIELLDTYVDTKVVIVDILPADEIDGAALPDALTAARPGVKLLYTSAHPRTTFQQMGVSEDLAGVLFKPYRKSALAIKLHELLDEQTAE